MLYIPCLNRRFIMGYSFEDIPIGFASFLIEPKKRNQVSDLDVAKNPIQVTESYSAAYKLISKSLSVFSDENRLDSLSRFDHVIYIFAFYRCHR